MQFKFRGVRSLSQYLHLYLRLGFLPVHLYWKIISCLQILTQLYCTFSWYISFVLGFFFFPLKQVSSVQHLKSATCPSNKSLCIWSSLNISVQHRKWLFISFIKEFIIKAPWKEQCTTKRECLARIIYDRHTNSKYKDAGQLLNTGISAIMLAISLRTKNVLLWLLHN